MKNMNTTNGRRITLSKLLQLGEYKQRYMHATINNGRSTRFMAANRTRKSTQHKANGPNSATSLRFSLLATMTP
eukprot:scaffold52617_cov15-Prasinocladus_malaysianus.AAC.1